jgi:SOS response associated peptidase (SRAP)
VFGNCPFSCDSSDSAETGRGQLHGARASLAGVASNRKSDSYIKKAAKQRVPPASADERLHIAPCDSCIRSDISVLLERHRGGIAALRDTTGNLPPLRRGPDYLAPIVRNAPDGQRELMMARWGMPGPPQFGGAPVTNIRNTKSSHWRGWLKPANRCVVPWTSFCEYADTKPKKTPTWFAFDETRPLAVFAGVWTTWIGQRGTKANPVEGEHTLFGFLTSELSATSAGFSREICVASDITVQ